MDILTAVIIVLGNMFFCVLGYKFGQREEIKLPSMPKKPQGKAIRSGDYTTEQKRKLKQFEKSLEQNPLDKVQNYSIDPRLIDVKKYR
jgi:hypothetical protein